MAERQSKTISLAVKALARLSSPTMGQLTRLHADSHGHPVGTSADGNSVCSLDPGVTLYGFALSASELLSNAPPPTRQSKHHRRLTFPQLQRRWRWLPSHGRLSAHGLEI